MGDKPIARFGKYLDAKDFSIRSAEAKLEMGNATLGKMIKREADVGGALLDFIIKSYPDLNPDWLRDGRGDMIKLEEKEALKMEATPLRLADPFGFEATGQKFYTLADGSEVMQIPVIPHKAWGSYLRGHADPEFYEGLETTTIPVDKQHAGIYLCFEMGGRSMVNIESEEMARKSLWPGQRIYGRDLQRKHWQYKLHINSNDAWIIVHSTMGIVVKEITKHDIDKQIITCHSWNADKEEYPDYEIFLNEVDQLFNVIDPFKKMRPY
jgi:hypothetical protein